MLPFKKPTLTSSSQDSSILCAPEVLFMPVLERVQQCPGLILSGSVCFKMHLTVPIIMYHCAQNLYEEPKGKCATRPGTCEDLW